MAVKKEINNQSQTKVTRRNIEELSGEKISACFQCEKCSNGCPLTFAMDILPHQAMHSIQLDLTEEVISSDTIWVCASCETCTTRCPNGIDIAHVMDTLRQLSVERGVKASQKQVPVFHKTFLNNIKAQGRMNELSMAVNYSFKAGGIKSLLKQTGLGLDMLRKGKIKVIPDRFRAGPEVKEIFRQAEGEK